MFRYFLAVSLTLATTSAIVCLPNYCDNVEQPELNCKGGVIKGGGFCGCTDICAKVRRWKVKRAVFSTCSVCPTQRSVTMVLCVPLSPMEGYTGHQCVNSNKVTGTEEPLMLSRRANRCETACQRKSQACTFSFVIYEGQWFSKCDLLGNFLPEQCDNTNHCFCVDTLTGEVQEDTKVLGSASCA